MKAKLVLLFSLSFSFTNCKFVKEIFYTYHKLTPGPQATDPKSAEALYNDSETDDSGYYF